MEESETISEFYHAERLYTKADLDSLQLMWADFKKAPYHHYYIKEIAMLDDGSFVVPIKWICVVRAGNENYCADVMQVTYDQQVGISEIFKK